MLSRATCLELLRFGGLEVRTVPNHILIPVVDVDYLPHAGQMGLVPIR